MMDDPRTRLGRRSSSYPSEFTLTLPGFEYLRVPRWNYHEEGEKEKRNLKKVRNYILSPPYITCSQSLPRSHHQDSWWSGCVWCGTKRHLYQWDKLFVERWCDLLFPLMWMSWCVWDWGPAEIRWPCGDNNM